MRCQQPAREALVASENEAAMHRYIPFAKHACIGNMLAPRQVLATETGLLCKEIGGLVGTLKSMFSMKTTVNYTFPRFLLLLGSLNDVCNLCCL
ncbi:hypothetical protein AMTR_s00045p00028370 [Amborella trichopoda]|uniref:Uncharacterized protein n=1 Tax=Amborella trichopoda TaxID=13333 RepID=W1P2V3_AMBTC|nr:hypothetical protein AMTR_s00045p00028370 [Amborella trichopoda]